MYFFIACLPVQVLTFEFEKFIYLNNSFGHKLFSRSECMGVVVWAAGDKVVIAVCFTCTFEQSQSRQLFLTKLPTSNLDKVLFKTHLSISFFL